MVMADNTLWRSIVSEKGTATSMMALSDLTVSPLRSLLERLMPGVICRLQLENHRTGDGVSSIVCYGKASTTVQLSADECLMLQNECGSARDIWN